MGKPLHKNLISIFLLMGVVTLAFCGIVSYLQYFRLSQSNNELIQSYQTIRAANQSLISIDEAALRVSSFLQTRDASALTQVPQLITTASVNFETLKQLVNDNVQQTELANELSPLFSKKIMFLAKISSEYSSGNIEQALQTASDENRLKQTNEIIQLVVEIKQIEIKQLDGTNANLKIYKMKAWQMIKFLGILSGFLFLCCFYLLNRYLEKY